MSHSTWQEVSRSAATMVTDGFFFFFPLRSFQSTWRMWWMLFGARGCMYDNVCGERWRRLEPSKLYVITSRAYVEQRLFLIRKHWDWRVSRRTPESRGLGRRLPDSEIAIGKRLRACGSSFLQRWRTAQAFRRRTLISLPPVTGTAEEPVIITPGQHLCYSRGSHRCLRARERFWESGCGESWDVPKSRSEKQSMVNMSRALALEWLYRFLSFQVFLACPHGNTRY